MYLTYFYELFQFLFSVRGDQLPHLTQIAGQELQSRSTFNKYVIPDIPISPSAERVTKICMLNQSEMLVNGLPVECVGIKQALSEFIKWLESFPDVVLVAHNGRRFDFVVLILKMKLDLSPKRHT